MARNRRKLPLRVERLEEKLLMDADNPNYVDYDGPMNSVQVYGVGPLESTDDDGTATYYAAPGMTIGVDIYMDDVADLTEMSVNDAKRLGGTFAEDDYATQQDLPGVVSHDHSDGPTMGDHFDFIVGKTTPGIITVNLHAHDVAGGLKTGKFKLDVEVPSGLVKVKGNSGLVYGNVDPSTGAPSNDSNSGQKGWVFSGQNGIDSPVEFTGIISPPEHISGTVFFTQLVNVEQRAERASGDWLYMTTNGFVQDGGPYVYQNFSQYVPAGPSANVPETPIFDAPTHVTDAPRFTPPTKAGDATSRVAINRQFQTMLMWQPDSDYGSVPIVLSTANWSQMADSDPNAGLPTPNGEWEKEGDGTVKFPEWVGNISSNLLRSSQGDWSGDGNTFYQAASPSRTMALNPTGVQAVFNNANPVSQGFFIPPDLVSDVATKKDKKR